MRKLEALHGREPERLRAGQGDGHQRPGARRATESGSQPEDDLLAVREAGTTATTTRTWRRSRSSPTSVGPTPFRRIQQQDVLEVITSNLTKKERLIIIMYYYEGLTMREIGDIMSLTESRVCQIHSNVMGRLKSQLKTLTVGGTAL